MRSHSWSELLPVALAATVEGLWAGALAAAVSGASGPALMAYAAVVVLAGALLAHRVARRPAGGEGESAGVGSGAGEGSGEGSGLQARALAAVLTLVAAGALLIASHAWSGQVSLWLVAADVTYAALLVVLGLALGGDQLVPEGAVSRAVRGFASLCVVLAGARLMAGATPAWATGALVVALLAGSLLVAATRYEALTALVPTNGRAPVWPWLLAVVGVVALVVGVGVLAAQVLRVDILVWLLAAVGGLLRFVLDALAFAVALVGALLIRAIGGVLGLFHVHFVRAPKPSYVFRVHVLGHIKTRPTKTWMVPRLAGTVVGALLAVAVPLALVVVALRRVRHRVPAEVVEEREAIVTLRSAAGGAAARASRRLRRFVARRAAPRTPAELVRRRYEELEHRLRRAGHRRSPGTTVRGFLGGAWASEPSQAPDGAALPPDAASSVAAVAAVPQTAADLAAIYELARYSGHAVDESTARRFEELATRFGAAGSGGVVVREPVP